jgi:hypothetical protein
MSKLGNGAAEGQSLLELVSGALSAIFVGENDSDRPITVEDPDLLFKGDYKRSGDDLFIEDERTSLVLYDYFRPQKRANLQSSDGAIVGADTVEVLEAVMNLAPAGDFGC